MNSKLTETFEKERSLLVAIAYRMLGEKAAAEDIVQEAWLRWYHFHTEQKSPQIKNNAAWLRKVVTRLAIDELRSARVRRETYIGPWLPEPIIENEEAVQEHSFIQAQECELALLWSMERLSPEQRAAFILREAFDASYAEIASVLSKPETTCRQLVSRAHQYLQQDQPRFEISATEHQDLLLRFGAAIQAGNRAETLSMLAPDALALSDGGGKVRAALRPLRGREEVGSVLLAIAHKQTTPMAFQLVTANKRLGIIILEEGRVATFATIVADAAGLIRWIYMMRNPDKLPAIPEEHMP